MGKLLVICGPTATGKTELGVALAKKIGGEIVSADSRQVYKGMDIGTGKDLPKNSKFKSQNFRVGHYMFSGIPVWLMDVVDPKESFSVADYVKLASSVIKGIWSRGKLPIIVGGTGLYIKAIVDGIETLGVPPNPELRVAYSKKTTDELFDILFHLSPETANSLNSSERRNKQRLIRRIEIASHNPHQIPVSHLPPPISILMIGLVAPRDVLTRRIEERVDNWIGEGVQQEVINLLAKGVSWDSQAMAAIGYREWRLFFEGKETLGEIVEKWKKDEWRYSKRQLTWFKKDKRINWFDVTDKGWEEKLEREVRKWYNRK